MTEPRRVRSGPATCGGCTAGILVGINGDEIERCDECALFEDDEDAIAALRDLAAILHRVYTRACTRSETVADALQRLDAMVAERMGVR